MLLQVFMSSANNFKRIYLSNRCTTTPGQSGVEKRKGKK